jgi:hypothetical protein
VYCEEQSEGARISAATTILDSGYGRPPQALQHEGHNGGLHVVYLDVITLLLEAMEALSMDMWSYIGGEFAMGAGYRNEPYGISKVEADPEQAAIARLRRLVGDRQVYGD